jgi:hypothetical protein
MVQWLELQVGKRVGGYLKQNLVNDLWLITDWIYKGNFLPYDLYCDKKKGWNRKGKFKVENRGYQNCTNWYYSSCAKFIQEEWSLCYSFKASSLETIVIHLIENFHYVKHRDWSKQSCITKQVPTKLCFLRKHFMAIDGF